LEEARTLNFKASIEHRTASEIANAIAERTLAFGAPKRSWLIALYRASRSPDDWALVHETWLRFGESSQLVALPHFARELLLAAVRCDAVPQFVDLAAKDGETRIWLSKNTARLLMFAVPADRVGQAFATLISRQPELTKWRRLLLSTLLRCEHPGAARCAPIVLRYLESADVEIKPELLAEAKLRARLGACVSGSKDAAEFAKIRADTIALGTVAGRAVAALAVLVERGESGVAEAVQTWNAASKSVGVVSGLFAPRCAIFPDATRAIRQFLQTVLAKDAAVVEKMVTDAAAAHARFVERIVQQTQQKADEQLKNVESVEAELKQHAAQ